MSFKILIVEDEADFREVLVEYLQLKGFEADGIESVAQYTALSAPQQYDLIVLDRTLPDGDGLSILEAFRKTSSNPVIILSGLGEVQDRVKGLDADADYYLVKPVKMPELLSIVNRYARRATPNPSMDAFWKINPKQWALISPCGIEMKLTNQELIFLICFDDVEGVAVARETIIKALGHRPEIYDLRRLETMVSRLRNKTKDAGMKEFPLATVYGSGYVFNGKLKVELND
mgnify:FL=1